MTTLLRTALWLVLLAVTPSITHSAIAEPPPLTEQQLEAVQECMGRQLWPYSGFSIEQVDPRDPYAFVERLIQNWWHGIPLQLLEAVAIAPEHFAPAVRMQLRLLPRTFDEHLRDSARDDPEYATTRRAGDLTIDTRAGRLLAVVQRLDRASAEPILREFFDDVQPVAVEAERRLRQATHAYTTGAADSRGPLRDSLRHREELVRVCVQAAGVARRLKSSIFVDDILEMLSHADVDSRTVGAQLASAYLPHLAAERPDALAEARAAAALIAGSEDQRVARAGEILIERLNAATDEEP